VQVDESLRLDFELSGGVNSRITGDLIFNASDVPSGITRPLNISNAQQLMVILE